MKQLQDNDKMPWGMHVGRTMMTVPADYFHHLWSKKDGLKNNQTCPVADYIRRNLKALKKEYPDGIWT